MKAPDIIYAGVEDLGNGYATGVSLSPREEYSEYIRKDSLWRPTEEQMNALNTTYTYLFNQTNGVFPCLHTLESLFGDLKKLKAL